MIGENITLVQSRIKSAAKASGRDASAITLVCVTKQASALEAQNAVDCGLTDIGENRVRDAKGKQEALRGDIRWHMIGHLQTNKAKDAVRMFDLIHSVDSIKLAEAIDSSAAKIGKHQNILIQVNVSGEGSKFGLPLEEIDMFLDDISGFDNVRVMGLMTMAPFSDAPEDARPYFKRLKRLFDDISERTAGNAEMMLLSMGMSGDFEVAIEEGSNIVRIGSAIFRK